MHYNLRAMAKGCMPLLGYAGKGISPAETPAPLRPIETAAEPSTSLRQSECAGMLTQVVFPFASEPQKAKLYFFAAILSISDGQM